MYASTGDDSILDMLLALDPSAHTWEFASVSLNGIDVNNEYWHVTFPKPGVELVIRVAPKDSKIIGAIAIIALAIVAPWAGGYLSFMMGSGGLVTTGAAGTLLTTVATAAVYAVGVLAINALINPGADEFEGPDDRSQALSIEGARNRLDPFGVMPMLLGRYKVFPPYATRPITSLVGDDQYITMLLCMGYKDIEVDLDTVKIGDVALNTYLDATFEVVSGGSEDTGAAITLTDEIVNEQVPGVGLDTDWSTPLATAVDTDRVEWEISFPTGLLYVHSDGDKSTMSVDISVEYSPNGTDTWLPVADSPYPFIGKSSVTFRRGFSWTPPTPGQWYLRYHASSDNDNLIGSFQIYFERFLTVFRSFQETDPVQHPDAAELAIYIRATDQLNGVPNLINYIGQSIVPDWTGAAWVDAPSSNCASLIRYVLTDSKVNARPLDVTRLNAASFEAFWDHCDTNNFEFNQLIDYGATLFDVIGNIAAAGRGRVFPVDGLWTIMIDDTQTTPIQVFTPRNSWDFTGEKVFPDEIHALRVRFVDEVSDYRSDEQIVYADGYTSSTAEKYEAIEFTGVTNWDQIWKMARYYLAIARLQPEGFTFSVDIENLVCLPMDRIEYQDDAILVGLGSSKVVTCTTTTLVMDAVVDMDNTKADGFYGVQFRKANGTVSDTYPVETETGEVSTLTFFPLESPAPADPDDIVVFGEVGAITIPMIVKNIRPGPDLSATLECLPYSDDIYTADSGVIPAYDPKVTQPPGAVTPLITAIRSDEAVMQQDSSGGWHIAVQGTLRGLTGDRGDIESILIQWRPYVATNNVSPWTSLSVLLPETGVFLIHESAEIYDGAEIEIRAKYIFRNATFGAWAYWVDPLDSAYHTVIGRTSLPPDVYVFSMWASSDGSRIYDWEHSAADLAEWPRDIFGYEIRYWAWFSTPNTSITDNLDDTYSVVMTLDNGVEVGEEVEIKDAVPAGLNGFHAVTDYDSGTKTWKFAMVTGTGDSTADGTTEDPLTPNWDKMTLLRTRGTITEAPYEANAPGAGEHVFAIVTVDDGGRLSAVPKYTNVIDLPLPRLGTTLVYRDAWALSWDSGATLTDCDVDGGTGHLVPDPVATLWSAKPLWNAHPEWQSDLADPIIFTDAPIDFGANTSVVFDVTIDLDTSGGATISPIEIREGATVGSLGAWGTLGTGTYTNFAFQLRFQGNNIPLEGIRNIITAGYAP